MKKSRFSTEQIIGFIKQADAGMAVAELCRQHGFSPASFYQWRAKYGGMEAEDGSCGIQEGSSFDPSSSKEGILPFATAASRIVHHRPAPHSRANRGFARPRYVLRLRRRLFQLTSNGGSYLIETDPRFADYRHWLSSDYLLNALGLDPTRMHKRLELKGGGRTGCWADSRSEFWSCRTCQVIPVSNATNSY